MIYKNVCQLINYSVQALHENTCKLCWDPFLSLVNFYFYFLLIVVQNISKTKNNEANADIKLNFNSYINRSNKAQKQNFFVTCFCDFVALL